MTTPVDPFEALDGISFWWREQTCTFRAKRIPDGRGDAFVVGDDDRRLASLTQHLGGDPLDRDEMFVPTAESPSPGHALRFAAMGLRLFRATGRYVDHDRASIWTFAICESRIRIVRRHERNDPASDLVPVLDLGLPARPKHSGDGRYVVTCPECREIIARAGEEARIEWMAADTVRRLGGVPRSVVRMIEDEEDEG